MCFDTLTLSIEEALVYYLLWITFDGYVQLIGYQFLELSVHVYAHK